MAETQLTEILATPLLAMAKARHTAARVLGAEDKVAAPQRPMAQLRMEGVAAIGEVVRRKGSILQGETAQ